MLEMYLRPSRSEPISTSESLFQDTPKALVFNHPDALERYDGDAEMLREMLRDFLQEAVSDLESLRHLVLADDPVAEKEAHRLKGACSYIAAERMRDCCTKLMQHVLEDDWEQARPLLDELGREWEAFQLEADRVIAG